MNEATREEKPNYCEGCTDASCPIYKLTITISAKGWATTRRDLWLCANCQHKLAFEKEIFFHV